MDLWRNPARLRAALAETFPGAATEVAPVVEQDWSEKWKDLVRSVETERLWVGPPWDAVKAPAGKVQVVLVGSARRSPTW